MVPSWLFGIPAKVVAPNIYEIAITGYGPAEVGAYTELRNHLGAGKGLESHHIVAVEHLRLTNTIFGELNAPSVAIASALHRQVLTPRIGAEQIYLGGRPHDGKPEVTPVEVLELYRQVYTFHTGFYELYLIAKNILG